MLVQIHDYCVVTLAKGVKKIKLLINTSENGILIVDNIKFDKNILPLLLIQFPDGRIDPLSNLGKLMTSLNCAELSELPGKEIEINTLNKKFYITGLN